MTVQDVLFRLKGVKRNGNQWKALCPAHADKNPSLSIRECKDGHILLYCHAGCNLDDIVKEMGITTKDLFVDGTSSKSKSNYGDPVAIYNYKDDTGNLLAQKLRYKNKKFVWRRPNGKDGWEYNLKGVPATLFEAGIRGQVAHIVEGEKDALNMAKLGFYAVSSANGAGGKGKWRDEYTKRLTGLTAVIIQDNDAPGKALAQETAAALHGVAKSVRVIDLREIWPQIPEHGDISDMLEVKGAEETTRLLTELERRTPEWEPQAVIETDPLLALFKPLEEIPEEEAEWVVEGWIPRGQIILFSSDGGIGKTSVWCNVIAMLSNGNACILDPPGTTRNPMSILFLTNEDSVRKRLKKKLRIAGANMGNITALDTFGDQTGLLHKLKFGTPEMEKVLRTFHPDLCVFDPIQDFIPPKANMASRNEMRDCLSTLSALGEKLNITFLIICHTNKRKAASGRDRIADSADIWDISRSVLMAGFTEEPGIRYLSNEKNNYAPLQETVLFSIDSDEQIHKEGTTWKRDKDYMQGLDAAVTAPKKEDCKAFILQKLEDAGGTMPTKDLETMAHNAGYAFKTIRNAKDDLKKENEIKYFPTGSARNGDNVWHTQLVSQIGFAEISENGPTPFDEPLPV